jgi:peptide/nickel transport system permease protein
MGKYFIRKLIVVIPMMLAISAIIFFALELTPADPVSYLISPDMAAGDDNIEVLRELYGLNDPVIVRYFRWLLNLLRGDFGYSIVSGDPIAKILRLKLPATLELAGMSLVISTILGIGLGVMSAVYQNRGIDYAGRFIGVVGISIPRFFFGVVLIQVFAVKMGWFPISGRISPIRQGIMDRLWHLALPATAMSITMLSALLRYTRNSLLDVLNQDYIKTARSKGIPEWKVYLKHAFRNSLGPVLVVLCFRLPLLIGGSVVIESVFAWPGIGMVIMLGVTAADYPVVMVTTLLVALFMLMASLLVDLLSAMLDPRIRLKQWGD